MESYHVKRVGGHIVCQSNYITYEIDREHIVEYGPRGWYYVVGGVSMFITDKLLAEQSEGRRAEIIQAMEWCRANAR